MSGKTLVLGVAMAAGCAAILCGSVVWSQETRPAGEIDWQKAQQLMAKFRSGVALTADEQAYLDRARAERARNPNAGGGQGPGSRPAAPPATQATGLVPLDEMGASDKYKGQDGGLYGEGKNAPPAAHEKAALAELAKVQPLDADGNPAKDGKIVFLSIGMSNTTQEFSKFKELADKDADKSPLVVIVDGAQGGMDAARWSQQAGRSVWDNVQKKLKAAGVTPPQVQVAWVKHARIGPAQYGEYPRHAEELKAHIVSSLLLAKKEFPNLRVAYLSSRIYAGWATTPLNPEPFAYEGGFVVRSILQDQVKGDAGLNFDAAKGQVKAPLLLWGPYLWADGLTPRKSDGLVWRKEDLGGDGTHPSPASGRQKVAQLLLDFVKTSPLAKGWFLKPAEE